jgi:hypothetical protein
LLAGGGAVSKALHQARASLLADDKTAAGSGFSPPTNGSVEPPQVMPEEVRKLFAPACRRGMVPARGGLVHARDG